MKRLLGVCLVLAMALFLFGALSFAATAPAHKAPAAAAAAGAKTVTGEIVDLSCLLGNGAKARNTRRAPRPASRTEARWGS